MSLSSSNSYDTCSLDELEEKIDAAIISENLDEIKELFRKHIIIMNCYEEHYDMLSTAIHEGKLNSLVLLLELINKRFVDITFNKCLEYSMNKCIELARYDFLHEILTKFGGLDLLKKICLEAKISPDLEKIYDGSFSVPIVMPRIKASGITCRSADKEIPLEIAIHHGNIEYIKNHIHEINTCDNGNLLEIAIDKEKIDIILFLVNYGANVNHTGYSYLDQAFRKKNSQIVQILIDAGIDSTRSIKNRTADDPEINKIINLLLEQNVDPVIMLQYFYQEYGNLVKLREQLGNILQKTK